MVIIKIGGGDSINLQGVVNDISSIQLKCIVVHGANALRDEIAKDLHYSKQTVTSLSGYSSVISDDRLIELMMMSYAGLKNKQIVELFQIAGINAVGLSGIDGRIIQGKRNSGIKTEQNGKKVIIRDRSGKPQSINTALLTLLLNNGYLPVLTVPIIDENGIAINSENDDIVGCLQRELQAKQVIHLIEAAGFLGDSKDPKSLISSLTREELETREQQATGRIKRKLLAIKRLFEHGAKEVVIADGRGVSPIQDALKGKGTVIR